ncbi:hypothetical protein E0H73_01680 [Kribbella pittospori]|uniref:Uncharacterized protein n=1 Tax=Kribbella pittospori TaxID=722689 RepID=A0A4R0L0P9_9ACTN|nr:hypothetical protein [Kribbella pittospori]TCC65674.1 hypothetical protein E0H73_01680 [Kribbella pittospori]
MYVRPPIDAPVDIQLRFVRQRLIALETRIGKERQEADQRIARVQEAGQLTDARVQAAIAAVDAKVREVATGNVRMQLGGLLLVGIGSVISTLPAVFGWH